MGGEQDDLVQGHAGDEVAHHNALPGVQPRRGLVQHQNVRVVQHGLGQQQPLLHAAGQGPGGLAPHLLQGQQAQQLPHPLLGACFGHPPQGGHVIQKPLTGKAGVEGLLLGHIAQLGPETAAHPAHILPIQENVTLRGGQIAGEDVQKGTFARPVGAQQAVDALFQGETHPPQGLLVPVVFLDILKAQFQFRHTRAPPWSGHRDDVVKPLGKVVLLGENAGDRILSTGIEPIDVIFALTVGGEGDALSVTLVFQ